MTTLFIGASLALVGCGDDDGKEDKDSGIVGTWRLYKEEIDGKTYYFPSPEGYYGKLVFNADGSGTSYFNFAGSYGFNDIFEGYVPDADAPEDFTYTVTGNEVSLGGEFQFTFSGNEFVLWDDGDSSFFRKE